MGPSRPCGKNLDQCLGLRLAQALADAQVSVEVLAAALDIIPQQVNDMLSGHRRMCPETLWRISRLTGKTIGWFYEDQTPPGASST